MPQEGLISLTSPSIDGVIADLDATRKAIATEDRKAYKQVSTTFVGWATAAARASTPQLRHFVGAGAHPIPNALAPSASRTAARVLIRGGKGQPAYGADGAFYGGHYPQFPPPVGNTWTPAVAGQGPYVLNDTAARHIFDLQVLFRAARLSAFSHLFPEA